ncbi:protein CLEC16A homolog [Condylostylus longicornis]|uniref:protein CLEC16A homolog n=1 Tax=Condylostylus longicornis TaxID=2530218 RepID=UPI00244E3786|nr:protein CLEC16A homolog [Condylostylus longicornis]
MVHEILLLHIDPVTIDLKDTESIKLIQLIHTWTKDDNFNNFLKRPKRAYDIENWSNRPDSETRKKVIIEEVENTNDTPPSPISTTSSSSTTPSSSTSQSPISPPLWNCMDYDEDLNSKNEDSGKDSKSNSPKGKTGNDIEGTQSKKDDVILHKEDTNGNIKYPEDESGKNEGDTKGSNDNSRLGSINSVQQEDTKGKSSEF